MTGPIDVYYWPTPNGWKIAIALEEMGLAYRIRPVDIAKGDQFHPDFLRISPNNKMPAIVDPDGPDGHPISLFETGMILLYLARKTGLLYGSDERSRLEVEQWLIWQVACLGPMFGQAVHFVLYAPALADDPGQVEYGRRRYGQEVNRLFGVMERRLEGRDYLAGDGFSIADIASWVFLDSAAAAGESLDEFPRVIAWVERIAARPSIARAKAVMADDARSLSERPTTQSEGHRAIRAVSFNQTARSVAERERAARR